MLDTKNYNILYVDDEQHNLNSFKAAFRRHYNIFTANSAKEGIEIMNNNSIHLIIYLNFIFFKKDIRNRAYC